MQVIIPAAGNGTRFRTAGFTEPKPLIPVLGRPMLKYVLDVVSLISQKPFVLCQKNDLATIESVLLTPLHKTIGQAIPIERAQAGAALSVLCANAFMDDTEPVLIVDADNIYDRGWFKTFALNFTKAMNYGSCLMTMIVPEGTTRYSYVRSTEIGTRVISIHEKDPVSNRVTCGVNFFSSWSVLRKAICSMVAKEDKLRGEFYLAPAYNYVQEPVYYFDVPEGAFHTVGTPEELADYEGRFIHGGK